MRLALQQCFSTVPKTNLFKFNNYASFSEMFCLIMFLINYFKSCDLLVSIALTILLIGEDKSSKIFLLISDSA